MAIDYPAGVYDLYMKYLNEMDQEGIASDTDSYIPQLPYLYPQGGDGGQDDPPDRRWDKEYDTEDFEALALRDAAGNIKYGLSEEEQALMDQIRMKQGLNLSTDYPLLMGGPFAGLGIYYNRRRASKRAEQELAALVANKEQKKAATEQAAKTAAGIGPTTGQGGAIDPGDVRDIGGGFHEYTSPGVAASYEGSFKKGGLATMFERRR